MPNLSRDQIRMILKYLEDTTEMNYRHLQRALENPRALLKGVVDTKEERKFGNSIEVNEQPEFFKQLSEEMKLSGRARQRFEWATHPRNIGTTLRRAQEHAKGKSPKAGKKDKEKDKDDDSGEPPAPRGFVRTMLGL